MAWLGLWNGLVLLIALFVLPWITTGGRDTFDARTDDLSLHPLFSELLEKVPLENVWNETPILYAVITCNAEDTDKCLDKIPDGAIRRYATLTRNDTNIESFRLIGQATGAGSGLRITIVVLLIWSLFYFFWMIAKVVGMHANYFPEGMRWALAGVGVLLVPLVLWYLPIVDTLGYRDIFGISTVAFLAGARVGPGIGWAFIGLLIGLVVLLISDDSSSANI